MLGGTSLLSFCFFTNLLPAICSVFRFWCFFQGAPKTPAHAVQAHEQVGCVTRIYVSCCFAVFLGCRKQYLFAFLVVANKRLDEDMYMVCSVCFSGAYFVVHPQN